MMKGRRSNWAIIAIVFLNLVLIAIHALAHSKLNVSLSTLESAFVGVVLIIAPILAAIFVWTRFRQAGVWLLLISMSASFVFGLVTHFLIPGPDNAFTVPADQSGFLFRVTTLLLGVAEAIGATLGALVLFHGEKKQSCSHLRKPTIVNGIFLIPQARISVFGLFDSMLAGSLAHIP